MPAVTAYHEQVSSRKRSAILAAATDLFMHQGYSGTSLAQIAKAADVSTATLFKRFSTKAALFDAIVSEYWEAERAPRDSPSPLDPSAGLTTIGRRYVELMSRDEMVALFRIVIAEAPRFPDLSRRQFELGKAPFFDGVRAYVEAADAAGTLQVRDPETAANQFLGMIANYAFWPRMLLIDWSPSRSELEHAVEQAVRTMMARYGQAPGPPATSSRRSR